MVWAAREAGGLSCRRLVIDSINPDVDSTLPHDNQSVYCFVEACFHGLVVMG